VESALIIKKKNLIDSLNSLGDNKGIVIWSKNKI